MQTKRLLLVAATPALLDAELESYEKLGEMLQAHVPLDWPPGEYDRAAIEFFRDSLSSKPENVGWYGWYAIDKLSAALVGAGGYMGPPDKNGQVEIGYSMVSEYQGRGYATEMVHGLINRVLSYWGGHIIARTTTENIASMRVLEKCGFRAQDKKDETGQVIFEYACNNNQ